MTSKNQIRIILLKSIKESVRCKSIHSFIYTIAFLFLLSLTIYWGDLQHHPKKIFNIDEGGLLIFFILFLLLSTISLFISFYNIATLNSKLVKIILEKPDLISNIYVKNKYWTTQHSRSAPILYAQYITFIDIKKRKYFMRVPSLKADFLLLEIAPYFPNAQFGNECGPNDGRPFKI